MVVCVCSRLKRAVVGPSSVRGSCPVCEWFCVCEHCTVPRPLLEFTYIMCKYGHYNYECDTCSRLCSFKFWCACVCVEMFTSACPRVHCCTVPGTAATWSLRPCRSTHKSRCVSHSVPSHRLLLDRLRVETAHGDPISQLLLTAYGECTFESVTLPFPVR